VGVGVSSSLVPTNVCNILREHMVGHKGFSTDRDPLFNRTNYALWSIRMQTIYFNSDVDGRIISTSIQMLMEE
jgi:hypothetical protein